MNSDKDLNRAIYEKNLKEIIGARPKAFILNELAEYIGA